MVEANSVSKKPITKRTWLIYSAVFLFMVMAVYSYFVWTGLSFIWESDGFTQHYPLFYDYVDKLQGLLRGEGFPQWDWSIGMGADTLTSYGYYVVGDPFVYLGVLFPASLRELAYHLLILLRMWCIGASFLVFVRKMNVSHQAGLIGAVMYAFSHYAIYNVVRHPFFILPMMWYPLLCLGVEKIFRKESGMLFALMVALSAVANFYFFYKLTLLTLLYGIVRFLSLYSLKDTQKMGRLFVHCLVSYMIGVLLSAVIFLPMVGGFLTSSRSPEGTSFNLFLYPLNYYFLLAVNLLSPGTIFWAVGGFSVFALFAVFFLWRRRSKKSFTLMALVILGIMVLFPFIGSFMNGFSGPYNRFTFVIPFYLALASCLFIDHLDEIQSKDLQMMRILLTAYTVFYAFLSIVQQEVLFYSFPILIGWGMWLVLSRVNKSAGRTVTARSLSNGLLFLVALNMTANAMAFYYPFGKNAMSETLDYGQSEEEYSTLFGGLEEKLPDDELYRVGVTSKDNHVRNQFVYLNAMGLNSYLSITDGDIAQFAYELESGGFQIIQPLRNGFDDRRIANHFLGVRFILTEEENEAYLPFGYEVVERTEGEPSYIVAETAHAFPFAYAEHTWMPYPQYRELNPVEKETFLTEGVVLEEADGVEELELHEGRSPVESVSFALESFDQEIVLTEDGAEVAADESQVTFAFDNLEELAGREVFVHVKGLDYQPLATSLFFSPKSSYRLRVLFQDQNKSILQSSHQSFSSYFHRNNMLFHVGYTDGQSEELTLQFDDAGYYSIESIFIYALPANEAKDAQIAADKWDRSMDIHTFEQERIEGSIDLEKPGVLVTKIPFTTGWKVTVNGEKVEPVKSNIGFIGVPLEAGESDLVFAYETPWLTEGTIISLAGLGCLIVYQVWFRRKQL